MYQVLFTTKAKKQFSKLEKNVQERIMNALERLRFNPERYITKLVTSKLFRLRVGDYRILLDLKKEKLLVLVVEVGHRKNIYKKID